MADDAPVNLPESAKELIGDMYGLIYWIASQVTGDPVWKLADSEMNLLGDKTQKFVASLGKRRATNVMKSLGKVGPSIALVATAAAITAPRVKSTLAKKKVAQRGPSQPVREIRPTPAAATATDSVAVEDRAGARPGGEGNPAFRERSFSAGDFEEISPGYAQSDT